MERTALLSQIVDLDARIAEATSRDDGGTDSARSELKIAEALYLRACRAEIQAKLNALPPLPQL